jgi:hypothetical protein
MDQATCLAGEGVAGHGRGLATGCMTQLFNKYAKKSDLIAKAGMAALPLARAAVSFRYVCVDLDEMLHDVFKVLRGRQTPAAWVATHTHTLVQPTRLEVMDFVHHVDKNGDGKITCAYSCTNELATFAQSRSSKQVPCNAVFGSGRCSAMACWLVAGVWLVVAVMDNGKRSAQDLRELFNKHDSSKLPSAVAS